MRDRFRQAWKRLRGGALSPGRAAASVGVGLFVACLPLYGAQLFLVLLVCIPLRLDAAVAYIVTHVSNPLTLPLFLWLELELGSLLMTGHRAPLKVAELERMGFATVGAQVAVGAVVSGVALGGAGAAFAFLLASRARDDRERELAEARRRTRERFAGAPRAVRSYVAIKLRTDPALEAIARLDGNFGRVFDAGCGHLQLGLCLHELGRAASLTGVDADATRVAVARAAAENDARVELSDLGRASFPESDTVLLVDSLHYLPLAAQNDVLARAAGALSPGGRLIIREVDSGASRRSTFTEWLERRAASRRGRGEKLTFRSSADLKETLERLGLSCLIIQHDEPSLVHNVLIVGQKTGGGEAPAREDI